MDTTQIIEALQPHVPAGSVEAASSADGTPCIVVAREHAVVVCTALRDRPELRFALAADITGVDWMPREPRFEVVLILASLGVGGFGDTPKRLRVKFRLPGSDARMPTLSGVWPAMNWGEREVYDLFGIHFDGHPDLRRILMPDDWDGHPARKDYPVQVKVPYSKGEALQLTPEQFAANIRKDRARAAKD
jgi:NADH-quinone oxidoreductase subunit C